MAATEGHRKRAESRSRKHLYSEVTVRCRRCCAMLLIRRFLSVNFEKPLKIGSSVRFVHQAFTWFCSFYSSKTPKLCSDTQSVGTNFSHTRDQSSPNAFAVQLIYEPGFVTLFVKQYLSHESLALCDPKSGKWMM